MPPRRQICDRDQTATATAQMQMDLEGGADPANLFDKSP